MQKIRIRHLGPIKECELNIQEIIVCTGPQASGKSTIAKSVFFFKNIKTLLFTQTKKSYLRFLEEGTPHVNTLRMRFLKEVRVNFLQTFGSTWCMEDDMCLDYYYTEQTHIRIFLKKDADSHNMIWIDLSDDFAAFLDDLDENSRKHYNHLDSVFDLLKREVDEFFADSSEVVYIPAGRSMITLLGSQLNYLYSFMDDMQKRSLDYCTRNYLERILRLKPEFSVSPSEMAGEMASLSGQKMNKAIVRDAIDLMKQVLQGEYVNKEGEERLQVSDDKYVKLNYASSGQQEVVWILNVLFYYLLTGQKAYFIIEEPESHLFPNAQKLITEFIALICNGGNNQLFLTTHSPYILGTINNLLYADKLSEIVAVDELTKIINKNRWLVFKKINALFVKDGHISSCVDEGFQSIENEVIDGASKIINQDYEKMMELKERYK